jgi:hypothetical protein
MSETIPSLFAVRRGSSSTLSLYQATLLQAIPDRRYTLSPPVYLITPYVIAHPPHTEAVAYVAPGINDGGQHVMFVGDYMVATGHDRRENLWNLPAAPAAATSPVRQVFFNGQWYASGRVLLSAYCATAIPIMTLAGDFRGSWPAGGQEVYADAGSPEIFRAWQQRWQPESWHEAIAREYAAMPVLLPTMDDDMPVAHELREDNRRIQPVLTPTAAVPSFVFDAIARDAVQRGATCPITMEPLTDPSQVAVTGCFHVFDVTALAAWRASGENKCPTCRAPLTT